MIRVSIEFTLPNIEGKDIAYLGLLDTGSTHNLISKELVTARNLITEWDDGICNTNNGNFNKKWQ